jgi:hypothetical protein
MCYFIICLKNHYLSKKLKSIENDKFYHLINILTVTPNGNIT